jgi:TRAP-type C4-dicarboxylate transport system permease small subunit
VAATSLKGYNGVKTPALSALLTFRAVTRQADRLYFFLGYICGLELLLLGFFITYQVVARKVGWVQAPGTDAMSGYILAMAVTWAFSYSLRSGTHVRIDVLLPYLNPRLRAIADWLALFAVGFFGAVIAWKMWERVISDYDRGVVPLDYPLTPLFIPKIVVALGFSLLVTTALQMMLSMIAESALPRLHRMMGGEDITKPITEGEASPAD